MLSVSDHSLNIVDNVIIFKKGLVDIISDGECSYYVAFEGSQKRCGGQGDVLAGILGTFSKYASNLDETIPDNEKAILAAVAASIVTRESAKIAF